MGLLEGIEKLITEHGSAGILRERIALAEQNYAALQSERDNLKSENQVLRRQLDQAIQEIGGLKSLEEDDVVIHRGIEFRRGHKTAGRWLAFCPVCQMPMRAIEPRFGVVCPKCKSHSPFKSSELDNVIAEIQALTQHVHGNA